MEIGRWRLNQFSCVGSLAGALGLARLHGDALGGTKPSHLQCGLWSCRKWEAVKCIHMVLQNTLMTDMLLCTLWHYSNGGNTQNGTTIKSQGLALFHKINYFYFFTICHYGHLVQTNFGVDWHYPSVHQDKKVSTNHCFEHRSNKGRGKKWAVGCQLLL